MAMRVVHIAGGLGLGGAETLLFRLVTHNSDVEHSVICLAGRDWYSERLEAAGVAVEHLNILSLRDLPSGLASVRRLLEKSRADVIQTWMYRANLLGAVAARVSKIPVVWSIHNSALPVGHSSRFAAIAGGISAGWLPSAVVNCSLRSTQLHRRLGYGQAPNVVIHNGFDPDSFYPDDPNRAVARGRLGVSDESFLIGTISRWHPRKDIPMLLRAVGIVARRRIPVRCILIGDGLNEDFAPLAAEIEQAGCAGSIQALGRRQDIVDLERAMDLHVLSSLSEAFPNVVAETMLCGTPNIVTDVGDSALMVGDSGWVVPVEAPDKIAEAIQEAYEEWKSRPDEWQKRCLRARALIADRFTFDKMVQAYERVWRTASSNKRHRSNGSDGE